MLVRLFIRPLGKDGEHCRVIGAQNIRRLGLALKQFEGRFAVEFNTNSNLSIVLGEAFIALAGEDQAMLYYRLLGIL